MGKGLKALILEADDDYLVGLGNKGILKRAYKELEQESFLADWGEQEVQVKLREETCTIRAPLGESSCTCPSRSICRHIVTAVLWLQKELRTQKETKAASAGGEEEGSQEELAEGLLEHDGAKTPAMEASPGAGLASGMSEEFLTVPVERLRKACGAAHLRRFLAYVRSDGLPPVEEGSIVTVKLPWEQAMVKLLVPLEYSSCTCHSKELCTHKAQALLAWRLKTGACTLQELLEVQEAKNGLDQEQVKRTCAVVQEAIELQICTGLSRQSPEVSESLERLAVLSHRTGLADLERLLRDAASGYGQYFARLCAFREGALLRRLLEVYRRAGQLQRAKDEGTVRRLAGVFKDSYEPVGRLHLVGMGMRAFQGQAGYEGETYYFLDTRRRRYLTWTDARPTIYEGVRKRPQVVAQESLAPWGLGCSRQQLCGMELELTDARLAFGGRLSSSQETKGEILGTGSLHAKEVRQMVVWDYRRLLDVLSAPEGRREHPVLVGAVRWGETAFDRVGQRFSWELFDSEEHRLCVSLRYTKEERLTIRFLERLEKRLKGGRYSFLVFFGTLYLEEGELRLYPIEYYLQEDETLYRECMEEAEEPPDGEEPSLPSEAVLDTMEQYFKEAAGNLEDLFISGCSSAQEELSVRLLACAKRGEELGLHRAGEGFSQIGELLSARRHQMDAPLKPLLEAWERLDRYLQICKEKISFDRARQSLCRPCSPEGQIFKDAPGADGHP